jgi:RHS repeat-associated protein
MRRLCFAVAFLVVLFAATSLFAAPSITNLSPTSGTSGISVTITGSGFGSTQGTSTVIFGFTTATVTAWNSNGNSITVTVPPGLLAGDNNVVVTVGGVASNAATFTVLNPMITSFSINAAPVDQEITITGVNFGSSQGSSTVTFNGVSAIPSFWNSTSIVVPIPTGATTGDVMVTVNGVASLGVAFMVVPPPQPPGVNFIQGNYGIAGTVPSSLGVPFPVEQTAGDLNVVVAGWMGSYHVTSVVDTAGNTYSLAVGPTSGTTRRQSIYYAKNISDATTNTVTVSFASQCCAPVRPTPLAVDVRVGEYSGLNTTSPVDVVSAATNTSSTANSGSATTTNANDLLIGAGVADGQMYAAGANYTSRVQPVNNFRNNQDILEDRIVTATGSYNATALLTASSQWVMQMVAFKEATNQAPVVDAGPSQTITLPTNTVSLDGTATDDGLPNNTLTITWSKLSGPGTVTFSSPNTANTQATFSIFGTYVLQLTANDSQLSTSSNVTITVNSQPVSLTLNPLAAGPDVTGTTQTMTAVLKNGTGPTSTPISGVSVSFTVTGPNATTGSATTNASGTATFTYTGANSGTDTVTASYTGQNSNSANVSWLVPLQPISVGTTQVQFFPSNGSCQFYITPGTIPAFTMLVPNINFNPPSGMIPGNNSGVNNNTRPFTLVTTDANGNFSGTMVAQGNGFQAGSGSMGSFQDVLTGSFTVATAGNVSFNIFTDDGFLLGVGGGATRVSGPWYNIPASGMTPFTNLPILEGQNTNTYPLSAAMVINFPAAGTYPFELDHDECMGFGLSLNLSIGSNSTPGLPPTGALSLSPITPSSLPTGQTQTFTAQVTDATGSAVPNAIVALSVTGANLRQLTATTNSTGQATFQYTGTNAGADSVQASAVISGLGEYSNQVNMSWTIPNGGGSTFFAPQGWIGSPTIGTVVQGQVPITVASGVNLSSGTLTYWPTSNPGSIATLNSNTTGSGTIGTFDGTNLASGAYTIQLNATSNGVTQVSQITVSVVGDNKPGRMKSTVTEFKVPLAGIPITITRTYDSLDKSKIEDFGYGWKLGTFVDLSVDAKNNVTFNFNGQKVTFFFTPQPVTVWIVALPWQTPAYTPQAGAHGSLISNGCGGLINLQGSIVCFPNTGQTYQPTLYQYTDPMGRVYTMTSTGQLQSIQDLNGNTLTIAQNGITSSVNGVVVPFVRDGTGRITQITDLNGNNYTYSYDGSGNLQSVQYPGLTAAETYTYASDHSMLTETDPRGNTSSAVYYSSANDGGNSLLDGRLFSITDTTGNTWSYTYNLSTNTTTTTNPDTTGTVVRTDDSFGKPLSITDPLNRKTTYVYDSSENLVSMTDPLNNTTTYTYNANGFQTSVKQPGLPASSKTYNPYGGVLTSTDAANTNTQTTTYDSFFNPVQTTDLLNGAGTFVSSSTFDALGNLLTSTDANTKTTQYAYDPNGNLIQVTDALNEVTRFGYDAMDRMISQTDPLGNTTQFTYDALGRITKKTDALGKITAYVYDNNGNKTSETDANNHTTSYQYDNMNRVTKITYPDTTFKTFTYDFRGNKLTEIDQLGRTTKYVYDLAGQLTSMTYAFGTQPPELGIVQYTYDSNGRQKTVKDELNDTTTNNYDAAGRLTSVQDALTNTTNYAYDADNRKTSATDPNTHTTSYAYDARSRLTKITYNDNTTTQYAYDGVGRQLTTTDQASKVTTKTYDAVGRLISVKDALNNLTGYFYDLAGNLKFLQDAAGRVTSYQYDALNRRTSRTLPLNQFESYTYDAVGNLATHTDFNGLKTTYTYDTLNRLLSKVPSSGTGISFTYTATGQRATMTDPSGTTNYSSYDNRNRLLTKATPDGTLTYTYDAHGNVLTINSSNTNGASMTFTYDALNRLASAKDNRMAALGGPSNPTTYSYDAAGNLSGYAYPNTVQTGNVFDTLNRLTQICEATSTPPCSAGTKLASYAYTLGNAGNRTNALELNNRNVAYGYDNDYRLISEAITADPGGNNGSENYTYDVVGNRFSLTSTIPSLPGSINYSYDSNDRLTTDSYDANGNTTSSAGIANTYDFENRMTGHGSLSLVYDGDGNRVSETIGGSTTKFLVDSLNPTKLPQVMDETVSGSVTRTYAYGLQRISENQLISGTWTPSFYGYDGHGNVRFLTNSAGAITDTYTYDAFGMQIAHTGTTPNVFQFSGEWLDSNVGLYYLRARYLNQATGRFWARDPIEGKKCCGLSWNPYIYVKQNPVNEVDPTGKELAEDIYMYAVRVQTTASGLWELERTESIALKLIGCVETWMATGLGDIDAAWSICLGTYP